MSTPAADKSPLERLLDAGVYAPLGYVLRRDEVKEDLAAAGRKQIAFARSLGRAALKTVGRGIRPDSEKPEPAANPKPKKSPEAPKPAVATEGPDVAIADYGSLTAKELISRLADASAAQAAWVIERENKGKKRVTVIRAANARLGHDG